MSTDIPRSAKQRFQQYFRYIAINDTEFIGRCIIGYKSTTTTPLTKTSGQKPPPSPLGQNPPNKNPPIMKYA